MAYIDHYYHYFYDEIWVGTTESIQSSTLKIVTPTNLWAHLNALFRFVLEILIMNALTAAVFMLAGLAWCPVSYAFYRLRQAYTRRNKTRTSGRIQTINGPNSFSLSRMKAIDQYKKNTGNMELFL